MHDARAETGAARGQPRRAGATKLDRRAVAAENPENEVTTTVYDAASQVTATVNPLGFRTSTAYDLAGRAVRQTDPLNRSTSTVYDVAGRAVAEEAKAYVIVAAVLVGERQSGPQRNAGTDDAMPAIELIFRREHVHRAALAF